MKSNKSAQITNKMNMAPDMNIMWLAMGAMFIIDCIMIYLHIKLHKKIQKMEQSGAMWRIKSVVK